MADEVLTITNFFHFGPPNNTRDYYDKRAQEYVDKYAKSEERNVKLIAKFYPVRDPDRPDEPDAMIADVEFNGTFTPPKSSETKTVPNQVVDVAADVKQQAEQKHQNQNSSLNKYLIGQSCYEFSPKVKVLKCDDQIKELHTVLRDRETSHSDFKFYSDRLV